MNKNGYTTIISMLIIGTVGVTIAISLLSRATTNIQSTLTLQRSSYARNYADICVEEGLYLLRSNPSFVGVGTLTLSNGLCSYEIIGTSPDLEIRGIGEVDETVRKTQVFIDRISPEINIISWQEVADF